MMSMSDLIASESKTDGRMRIGHDQPKSTVEEDSKESRANLLDGKAERDDRRDWVVDGPARNEVVRKVVMDLKRADMVQCESRVGLRSIDVKS